MPRRRQRYKNLLQDLKKLNGATPDAGTDAAKFLDYLTGKNKIKIYNKVPSGGKDRFNIAVIPFAVSPTGTTADQGYKATITAYSYAGLKGRTGLDIADFGISFIEAANKNADEFYPALIKPSYSSSNNLRPATTKSAVTNKAYEYKRTRTFSIPCGRTLTVQDAKSGANETNISQVDELDTVKSLKVKMFGKTDPSNKPVSIGYEPEFFKPQTQTKDATQESDIPITNISVN